MELIEVFDSSIFEKIPLYKTIYNPFMPLGVQLQKDLLLINNKFENLKVSLNQRGNCEYIYGFNDEYLDVICCVKNIRYRFILPFNMNLSSHLKQQQKMKYGEENNKKQLQFIEIRNRLLIIMYKNHVFVHDLVRNNNRLVLDVLYIKQLQSDSEDNQFQLGICTLETNYHYIYRVHANPSANSIINVQLYNIDMSDNLNIKLAFNKIVKLPQTNANIIKLSTSENNCQLVFSVLIWDQQKQTRRFFIYKICKLNSNLNLEDNVRLLKSCIQGQFFMIQTQQVDEMLVNICGITCQQSSFESSMKYSWALERQSSTSNKSNPNNKIYGQISIINSQDCFINYCSGRCQFLITHISPQKEYDSNHSIIIEHEQPIVQIIFHNSSIVVLDEKLNIWSYDSNPYSILMQQSIKLANLPTKKNVLNEIDSQYIKNFKLLSKNRIGLIVGNQSIILQYPKLIFPNYFLKENDELSKDKVEDASVPTFLSIQSSNFCQMQFIEYKTVQSQIGQKIGQYLSLTSTQPQVNAKQQIMCQTLKIIKEQMQQNKCFAIIQHQVWGLLIKISLILAALRSQIFGSVYDCSQNYYYWLFPELISSQSQSQSQSRDMKIVIHGLVEYLGSEGWRVLETILNEYKFISYLTRKSKQNLYSITCTTYFGRCKLSSGCACPYRRLVCFILGSAGRSYKQYSSYQQIAKIMMQSEKQSSWMQEVQKIANSREEKIHQQNQKQLKLKIKEIDKKWLGTFSQSKHSNPTNGLFSNISEVKNKSISITYQYTQQELNQLYRGMESHIVQQILRCKYNENIINQPTTTYFQQIYRICTSNNLLFNYSSLTILTNPRQYQSVEAKIKICIIAANQIYHKFTEEINAQKQRNKQHSIFDISKEMSMNKSINDSECSIIIGQQLVNGTIYRKYWILITQLICEAQFLKYIILPIIKNSKFQEEFKNMLLVVIKAIISSKYLPAVVTSFKSIMKFKTLSTNQMQCLVQCILRVEMYKFEDYDEQKAKEKFKFRYSPQIWSKGIEKLIDMSIQLKNLQ